MTYYHPCKGCAIDPAGCDKRKNIKTALAGLSITSLKFKCAERKPLFYPGQRVSFSWAVCIGQDHEGEGRYRKMRFNGTVICESSRPTKFTVRVDQDGDGYTEEPKNVFRNGGDVVNVRAADLVLLGKPDCTFCPSCLQYEGETGRCWDKSSGYIGCLEYSR